MLDVIKVYFLPCLVNIIVVFKIISLLLNKELKFNSKKVIFVIIILTLLSILNYCFMLRELRFINSTFMILFFTFIIFDEKMDKIIIATILEQILLFISELIYSFIIINLFGGVDLLFYNDFGIMISNIFICLIPLLFVNNNFIINNMRKFIAFSCKMNYIEKYILLFLFIVIINFLLFYIYDEYNNISLLFFNVISIIFYGFVLYVLFNEKVKNVSYIEENKALISNLNEYEKMLDYQRVNNHENKNQLLVIKEMIRKNKKDVIKYIDEIIKDKREDNEILYTKTKKIPSGGVQGLIYQKMLLGQENHIKFVLQIDDKIKRVNTFEDNTKLNYDVCRILGIVLDNAIEEIIKFEKNDREILIYMYVDEYLIIEVSNKIVEKMDTEKILNNGYTTKGKNHGYGLSLLKKIIFQNDRIENEIKIVNNVFSQIIKIKM